MSYRFTRLHFPPPRRAERRPAVRRTRGSAVIQSPYSGDLLSWCQFGNIESCRYGQPIDSKRHSSLSLKQTPFSVLRVTPRNNREGALNKEKRHLPRRAKGDRSRSRPAGPQSCAAISAHLVRKLLVPRTGGRPPFSPLILVKNFPRLVFGPVDFLALATFAASRAGVIFLRWQRGMILLSLATSEYILRGYSKSIGELSARYRCFSAGRERWRLECQTL
jgi:hypothetical protein